MLSVHCLGIHFLFGCFFTGKGRARATERKERRKGNLHRFGCARRDLAETWPRAGKERGGKKMKLSKKEVRPE